MRRALAPILAMLAACSAAPSPPPPPPPPALEAALADAGADGGEEPAEATIEAKVKAMSIKVAAARGLPLKGSIACKVLDRAGMLARIRKHVEAEIPKEALVDQGDALAALELVPPEYDFIEGAYALVGGRIAGYYEPADKTMYLVADLEDAEADETLAHELVHALQDQSFDIAAKIKYVQGKSDAVAAAHALAEGDATSAMLDVSLGSAFQVSPSMFEKLLAMSTALSEVGRKTPGALRTSLEAPYTDGFAFVQNRRKMGGWPKVDEAWRALPTTTEQLLHPDKYDAREPAITVAAPTVRALPGFRAASDDEMGEQSMRIVFGEWSSREDGERAASGWGGDRYVIARRDTGDRREIALGWRMVFDTPNDAAEAAALLKGRFGASCKERPGLGPLAWVRKKSAIALVAGPFSREGQKTKSAGTCALARAWLREIAGS